MGADKAAATSNQYSHKNITKSLKIIQQITKNKGGPLLTFTFILSSIHNILWNAHPLLTNYVANVQQF
jgi:hypothetical protein